MSQENQDRARMMREWMDTKDASGRVLIRSVGAGFVRVKPGTNIISFYLSHLSPPSAGEIKPRENPVSKTKQKMFKAR